jgi:hypothetical protein
MRTNRFGNKHPGEPDPLSLSENGEVHSRTDRMRTQGAPDRYAGFVTKKSQRDKISASVGSFQRDKISASVGSFPGCAASKTTWQGLS